VTAIGFRSRRPIDAAGASRPPPPSVASGSDTAPLNAHGTSRASRSSQLPPRPVSAAGWVRVGTVRIRSALRYLIVWAVVLFGILALVLGVGYVLLAVLGVTGSVSRALAVVLDEEVPASGVLPVLQPQNVLPAVLLASAVVSFLWLVSALAAVLVHNAVSVLTGGVRVRIRTEMSSPPRRP
jgi:hypothetical protein